MVSTRRAHPRSRGENSERTEYLKRGSGSSPLTRGKRGGRRKGIDLRRLIPAHAGKTRPHRAPGQSVRAHPRSRGENGANVNGMSLPTGSSPLTRGKRCEEVPDRLGAGLIPAHAGKTPEAPRRCHRSPAHPRSRGENSAPHSPKPPPPGSSPLTRGKPPEDPEPVRDPGLIPAHAGKTSSTSPTSWQGWAHPRSRGENHYEYANPENIKGSSPLTRGKHPGRHGTARRRGLIPAHAGKTSSPPSAP